MSQSGLVDVVSATPTIPTSFDTDSGTAIPVLNTVEVLGATVANATYAKAVFVTGSGNTVTLNAQVAAAIAAADVTKAGVSTYDSSQFTVDANGHVSLTGGGLAIDSVTTDDAAVVVPDGTGNINIIGVNGISTIGVGSTVTVSGVNEQNIIYVAKHGDDANSGLNIGQAKLTIQAAVTVATANSTILVYPGTYAETVTHTADNVTVIAQGKPNTVILTQADANVIDFGTYTGIQYKYFGVTCTAATTAINTVQGSTGGCTFKECHLSMTSSADIVASIQPAVGAVTGVGQLTMRIGQVTYAHTGNGGGTAQKGAFRVGDGGVVELGLIKNLDISNSGTALVSSVCLDTSSTGYFDIYENDISVTDPDATLVVGLGYLAGTGVDHEFRRNTIHITATANAGYGIFCADTASTTRSFYNHIHVVDTGGSSYGFYVGAGSTLASQLDDIVAADGNNISGTFIQANSESDGDFTASDTVYATTFDTNVAAAGVTLSGTTLAADGTDANIPVTITPKGTEAVTIDGLDYPMADGTLGQAVTTNGSSVLSFGNAIAGGGLEWEVITSSTKQAVCNHAYICNLAAGVTVTLPATCAVGCIVRIVGMDGNWAIAQNASQTCYFSTSNTTTGVGGSITATDNRDCIEMVCTVANTDFTVISSIGNMSIV